MVVGGDRASRGPGAAEWYGASAEGNWEGKNILWRPALAEIARPTEIDDARLLLLERRQHRPRPGLDAKVLTEWNAMAISALASAGTAFGQPAWTEAAAGTAEVLMAQLRRPDGRWLRSWRPAPAGAGQRDDKAGPLAYAGDYAWLVEAFTRLGEATGQSSWTSVASETARSLLELFWDKDVGGFFTYGNDAEELIARMKDLYDGATPSANATAAVALARLGELTGDDRLIDAASQTVDVMAPALSRPPRPSRAWPWPPATFHPPAARWSSHLSKRPSSVPCGNVSCRTRSWPGGSPTHPRSGKAARARSRAARPTCARATHAGSRSANPTR